MKAKYTAIALLTMIGISVVSAEVPKNILTGNTESLDTNKTHRLQKEPQRSLNLEQKIELVAKLKDAKQAHDIDALLALYHPECVVEQPSLGVRSKGYAELKPKLAAFAKHFPDYKRSLDGFAQSGDTLIAWGETTVTLSGDFSGMIPNGKKSNVMTFVMFKFSGNRIIYEGHYWDIAAIARQSDVPVEAIRASAAMGTVQ